MCRRGFNGAVALVAVPWWVYELDFEPFEAHTSSNRCCSRRNNNWQVDAEDFELRGGCRYAGHTPVDVTELPDGYRVTVDVPGLSREQVIVLVDEDQLVVAGDFGGLGGENEVGCRMLRSERAGARTFERRFKLPRDVLGEAVAYDIENGVLTVFLPKKFQAEYESNQHEAGPSGHNETSDDNEMQEEQWQDVLEESYKTYKQEQEKI
eukprot:TRINITY_DN1240_c0_g1_i5.p3 TRINITY_DN1240_c0_g1~~TRINITY_DN1240_c0_g1_i5.p3  ORF type:complete len:208 (-),score=47.02 TRINITY_DN1240_c0_g1_i5:75-698(-)